MKVVLIADVKKLGRKGEVKEVSPGYAQNILLPKKLAIVGTPENIKKAQKEIEQKEDNKALNQAFLSALSREVEGKTVTLHARANDQGTLFEAIHERHVVLALKNQLSIEVPESFIRLIEPLKTTGEHQVLLGEGKKILNVQVKSK